MFALEFLNVFYKLEVVMSMEMLHLPSLNPLGNRPYHHTPLAKLRISFPPNANATEEFPSIVCRLFLVYGPGQKLDRFIPQVMTACLKNKHFPVTPGMHFRDFTYIEDIVDAMLLTNQPKGQVLNIGSGYP